MLRMNDRHDHPAQRTQRHKPLFCVGDAVIFVGERNAIKNLSGIDKVEPVLLEIGLAFSFIPVDHPATVYTLRVFVNGGDA